jgi:hypothetical protein
MTLGWFAHIAGDRALASAAGLNPNPTSTGVEAMAEVGLDISSGFPNPGPRRSSRR